MKKLSMKKILMLTLLAIGSIACFGIATHFANNPTTQAKQSSNTNTIETEYVEDTKAGGYFVLEAAQPQPNSTLGMTQKDGYWEISTKDQLLDVIRLCNTDMGTYLLQYLNSNVSAEDFYNDYPSDNRYPTGGYYTSNSYYEAPKNQWVNQKYRLTADITLPSGQWSPIGRIYTCKPYVMAKLKVSISSSSYTWAQAGNIETRDQSFTGVFDGNGHTITLKGFGANTSTLSPDPTGFVNYGLFGHVKQATNDTIIKNLNVIVNEVNSTDTYDINFEQTANVRCGGLVGYLEGYAMGASYDPAIEYCTVTYSAATEVGVYSSCTLWWGGLVGYATNARIENCMVRLAQTKRYFEVGGDTSYCYVGGLVGGTDSTSDYGNPDELIKIYSCLVIGGSARNKLNFYLYTHTTRIGGFDASMLQGMVYHPFVWAPNAVDKSSMAVDMGIAYVYMRTSSDPIGTIKADGAGQYYAYKYGTETKYVNTNEYGGGYLAQINTGVVVHKTYNDVNISANSDAVNNYLNGGLIAEDMSGEALKYTSVYVSGTTVRSWRKWYISDDINGGYPIQGCFIEQVGITITIKKIINTNGNFEVTQTYDIAVDETYATFASTVKKAQQYYADNNGYTLHGFTTEWHTPGYADSYLSVEYYHDLTARAQTVIDNYSPGTRTLYAYYEANRSSIYITAVDKDGNQIGSSVTDEISKVTYTSIYHLLSVRGSQLYIQGVSKTDLLGLRTMMKDKLMKSSTYGYNNLDEYELFIDFFFYDNNANGKYDDGDSKLGFDDKIVAKSTWSEIVIGVNINLFVPIIFNNFQGSEIGRCYYETTATSKGDASDRNYYFLVQDGELKWGYDESGLEVMKEASSVTPLQLSSIVTDFEWGTYDSESKTMSYNDNILTSKYNTKYTFYGWVSDELTSDSGTYQEVINGVKHEVTYNVYHTLLNSGTTVSGLYKGPDDGVSASDDNDWFYQNLLYSFTSFSFDELIEFTVYPIAKKYTPVMVKYLDPSLVTTTTTTISADKLAESPIQRDEAASHVIQLKNYEYNGEIYVGYYYCVVTTNGTIYMYNGTACSNGLSYSSDSGTITISKTTPIINVSYYVKNGLDNDKVYIYPYDNSDLLTFIGVYGGSASNPLSGLTIYILPVKMGNYFHLHTPNIAETKSDGTLVYEKVKTVIDPRVTFKDGAWTTVANEDNPIEAYSAPFGYDTNKGKYTYTDNRYYTSKGGTCFSKDKPDNITAFATTQSGWYNAEWWGTGGRYKELSGYLINIEFITYNIRFSYDYSNTTDNAYQQKRIEDIDIGVHDAPTYTALSWFNGTDMIGGVNSLTSISARKYFGNGTTKFTGNEPFFFNIAYANKGWNTHRGYDVEELGRVTDGSGASAWMAPAATQGVIQYNDDGDLTWGDIIVYIQLDQEEIETYTLTINYNDANSDFKAFRASDILDYQAPTAEYDSERIGVNYSNSGYLKITYTQLDEINVVGNYYPGDTMGVSESRSGIVRVGYRLAGWQVVTCPTSISYTITEPTSTTYSFARLTIKAGSMGNATFRPIWEPITYNIQYNAKGGTGTVEKTTHTADDNSLINQAQYIREGYEFKGWGLSQHKVLIDASDIATTQADEVLEAYDTGKTTRIVWIDKTIILYAVWEPNSYWLSLNLNDSNNEYKASFVEGDYSPFNYGASVYYTYYTLESTFELPLLTREHYTFKGWKLELTGTTGSVSGGISEYVSATEKQTFNKGNWGMATLTAQWECSETYTITITSPYAINVSSYILSTYTILSDFSTVANVLSYTYTTSGIPSSVTPAILTLEYNLDSVFYLPTTAYLSNVSGIYIAGYQYNADDSGENNWTISTIETRDNSGNVSTFDGVDAGYAVSGMYGDVNLTLVTGLVYYELTLAMGDTTLSDSYLETLKTKVVAVSGLTRGTANGAEQNLYTITYCYKNSFTLPSADDIILGADPSIKSANKFVVIEANPTTYWKTSGTAQSKALGYSVASAIGDATLQLTLNSYTKYTITLNANGGSIAIVPSELQGEYVPYYQDGKVYYIQISTINEFPTPIRMGYTFIGWKIYSGGTLQTDTDGDGIKDAGGWKYTTTQIDGTWYAYPNGIYYGSTGNATLIAQWKATEFTLTLNTISISEDYEPWSGCIASGKLVRDETAGTITIYYTIQNTIKLPTVGQYISAVGNLTGWEVSEANGNWSYTTLTPGMSYSNKYGNVILTPIRDIIEHQITLDLDSDDATISYTLGTAGNVPYYNSTDKTISYNLESNINLPTNLTRTGYTFSGWTVKEVEDDDDNDTWYIGEYFSIDDINECINNGTYIITQRYGNVTLIAQWTPNVYYIEYNGNGATSGEMSNSTHNYGEDSKLSKNEYEKTGYTFMGWSTVAQEGAEVEYVDEDTINLTPATQETITIYAVWERATGTIILNLNDDEKNPATLSYELGTAPAEGEQPTYPYYKLETIEDENVHTIHYIYDTINGFDLPNSTHILRGGYKFVGWKATIVSNESWEQDELIEGEIVGRYGDVTLTAQWELITYTIVLQPGDGEINGYTLTADENGYPLYDEGVITYTTINAFELPTESHMPRLGYTFVGWASSSSNPSSIKFTTSEDYVTAVEVGSFGNGELTAIWQENKYTVVLNANDGWQANNNTITTKSLTINYSDTYTIDWDVIRHTGDVASRSYIFVGWSANRIITDINTNTPSYQNIYDWTQLSINGSAEDFSNKINSIFGNAIVGQGTSFERLVHGDISGDTTVTLYAVWLPVYKIFINANDAQVYNNGELTEQTGFTYYQTYYGMYDKSTNTQLTDSYLLYTQDTNTEVLTPPTASGYRLHKKYSMIESWKITVGEGNIQYYMPISANEGDIQAQINAWTVLELLVASGTNMQYLQGDITATPQWADMTFDVIFQIKGTEGYKSNISTKQLITQGIKISSPVAINETIIEGISTVLAININGYTPIYVMGTTVDGAEIKLPLYTKKWNYDLEYIKYAVGDGYVKDDGWYVIVEGYYAPDLYRVQLMLDLPYDAELEVNPNGFVLTETTSSLALKHVMNVVTVSGVTDNSATYESRRNKLFKFGGNYYIYLQQDQIIKDGYVYDAYLDGKAYVDDSGVQLPTFSIPYYEMQYYYANIDKTSVQAYQLVELDAEQVQEAKINFTALAGDESNVAYPTDWKYAYCNANAEAGSASLKLNVYWYRNRVNLNVNNILEGKDSFNGYAIVTETEQVTDSLQGHNKYNLVIFTTNPETEKYEYIVYGFNDETLLYNILDVVSSADATTTGNTIQIYFGNSFTIEAVDQSKDHTLDEFIGYRFTNYSYTLDANVTSISEIDEATGYTFTVDLQNYEEGVKGNTTNYFLDRDNVNVQVHFEKIKYTLSYETADTDGKANDKYGIIQVTYQNKAVQTYTFTVDDINSIISTLTLNLGYELQGWYLKTGVELDNEEGQQDQTYMLLLNAEFLRNHVYTTDYAVEDKVIDTIQARCQNIEFAINVNVLDTSTNTVVNGYTLATDTDNALFTLQSEEFVVTRGNTYTLVMTTAKGEDGYVYYTHEGTAYAILGLYIAPSINRTTNSLATVFEYPSTKLQDITMAVDYTLLDQSVNYEIGKEVDNANRVLNFYVQVSPTVELSFTEVIQEVDQHKGGRQLKVGDTVVATADEGQVLTTYKYLGYVGQKAVIEFKAGTEYYSKVNLSVDYTDESLLDETTYIPTNSNIVYTVQGEATVLLTLEPRTYIISSAKIKYNGTEYDLSEYADVKNARGVSIVSNVALEGAAPYYYGSQVKVTCTLNESIASDYEVIVTANGNGLRYQDGAWVATFTNADLDILIEIKATTQDVTLQTNMTSEYVADIYVSVNEGERTPAITNAQSKASLSLENGDSLTVYVKSTVGYAFEGYYTHMYKEEDVVMADAEDGYIKFTLFADGYNPSEDRGTYTLHFYEVPVAIQYVYWDTTTNTELTDKPTGYTYTVTNLGYIKEDTKITLVKGTDNLGYRFDGYTYVSPKNEETSKEFNLDETQSFNLADLEVLAHLSAISVVDSKLTLKVYVNYVEQYTYKVEYTTELKAIVEVRHGEEELEEGKYYDYGTELDISVYTSDTAHYYIEISEQDISVLASTTKGNMSSVRFTNSLTNHYIIQVGVKAEKYYTKLTQHTEEELSQVIDDVTDEDYIQLGGYNMYYKLEGTHEYGTDVNVTIYVVKEEDSSQNYYALSEVSGATDTYEYLGEHTIEVEGTQYVCYTYEVSYKVDYTLTSNVEPSEQLMLLNVSYVPKHYVGINPTETDYNG